MENNTFFAIALIVQIIILITMLLQLVFDVRSINSYPVHQTLGIFGILVMIYFSFNCLKGVVDSSKTNSEQPIS